MAMLTSLSIENFKAFGRIQTIPIRPITLIFGANSSGKSSVIHSLLLANHALEADSWDIHKAKHGGQEVDLGGFPHFLHRPRTEDKCSFGFKLSLTKIAGMLDFIADKIVAGTDQERSPFRQLNAFGGTLEISKAPVPSIDGTEKDVVALQSFQISFDGQPALQFVRTSAQTFQCNQVLAGNPFIRNLIVRMVEMSSKQAAEDAAKCPAARNYEGVFDRMLDHVPSATELKERAARYAESKEAILRAKDEYRVRAIRCADPATIESELVEAAKALSEVMAERVFVLKEGGILVDSSPDKDYFAGWRDWLEDGQYGGVLGFFNEFCEDSEDRGPVEEQRWAEAQAIRYNLVKLLAYLSRLLVGHLNRLMFLGPVRPIPPRHLLEATSSAATGMASGLESWIRLSRNPQLQESVNRWLGPGWLNTPYRIRARSLVYADEPTVEVGHPEIQFDDVLTGARVGVPDLGFGMSQVLPVLVNAASLLDPRLKGRFGHIIAVEQPELHLHPAMQAELGDVFIESAMGDRRSTLILETHSEHLILRILRRIRETTADGKPGKDGLPPVRPEDVSVIYVQPGPNGSEIVELPVTPDGDFSRPWPKGFFAERAAELF